MKSKIFLIALLIVGTATTYAQRAKLGEVRYSLLDPEKFINLNGKSWVLMDGRNISGTDLAELTSATNIPDGRGVFIRGANAKRDPQSGDPDGDRPVGSFQRDEVVQHSHVYSDAHFAEINGGNQGLQGNKGDSDYDNGRLATNQTTQVTGGAETRPRNIVLYSYLKVNKRRSAQGSGH